MLMNESNPNYKHQNVNAVSQTTAQGLIKACKQLPHEKSKGNKKLLTNFLILFNQINH